MHGFGKTQKSYVKATDYSLHLTHAPRGNITNNWLILIN